MPIYEFRCLSCNHHIEMLVMGSDEKNIEMTCEKCGGVDLERVISATSYAMGNGSKESGAATQTRNCSSGSCTTWSLPGHSR